MPWKRKGWFRSPHSLSSRVYQTFPDSCTLGPTAKELRDLRLLLGYSQTRLAQAIGVPQISTISDWEQGKFSPSPSRQAALRRALLGAMPQFPLREWGDGTWERGEPRLDAAAQWGRGERIGARPLP